MIWTDQEIETLKQLCLDGLGNRDIAGRLNRGLTEVYAKRSQLGITIAKCKGVAPNPAFEKALEPIAPSKVIVRAVRDAFKALGNEVLWAMARDWTTKEDSDEYCLLANELIDLEAKYNKKIGR